MLRSLTMIFALGFSGALLLPLPGEAAGRSVSPAAGHGSVGPTMARSHGSARPRVFAHRGQRLARFHGRGFIGGPLLPPFDDGPQLAILHGQEREPETWIDRNSVASLPTRTGIPYPPTPDPILIRLEGRRDRPVARIFRIAEAESGRGSRSRFVHTPTGALLLMAPGR